MDPISFAADPPFVLSVHKSKQVETICALQTQGNREQSGFSEAEIIHYVFLQGSLFMLGDCIKVMEQNNILFSSLPPPNNNKDLFLIAKELQKFPESPSGTVKCGMLHLAPLAGTVRVAF